MDGSGDGWEPTQDEVLAQALRSARGLPGLTPAEIERRLADPESRRKWFLKVERDEHGGVLLRENPDDRAPWCLPAPALHQAREYLILQRIRARIDPLTGRRRRVRDLFTADFDREPLTHEELEEFLGLDRPADDRPVEGTRLDFKGVKPNGELDTHPIGKGATALANMFGGIIVVGVSENNGRPTEIRGVIRRGDLKTRLQSYLHTSVVPPLPVGIGVAEIAASGSREPRDIAVIQIPEGPRPPYAFAEGKETQRIYVRANDRSGEARLSDVDALYEKRAQMIGRSEGPPVPSNGSCPHGHDLDESGTYAQLYFRPERALYRVLHRRSEAALREAVLARFPSYEIAKHDRSGEHYSFESCCAETTHRWHLDESGVIGFATSIMRTFGPDTNRPGQRAVFLIELIRDLMAAIAAGRAALEDLGWLGRIELQLTLVLKDVQLANFSPHKTSRLAIDATSLETKHVDSSGVSAWNENSELIEPADFLGMAMCRLLRNMRQADVDLDAFTESIRVVGE